MALLVHSDLGDQVRLVWLNDSHYQAETFRNNYNEYLKWEERTRSYWSEKGYRRSLTRSERYEWGGKDYREAVAKRFDSRFGQGAFKGRQRVELAKTCGVGFGSALVGGVAGRYVGSAVSGGDQNWGNVGGFVGSQSASTVALTAWSAGRITFPGLMGNAKAGFAWMVPTNAAIELGSYAIYGIDDYATFENQTRPDFSGGVVSGVGSYLNASLNAFSSPLRSTLNVADSLVNPYAYYQDATGAQPGRTLIGHGLRSLYNLLP